MDNFDTIYSIIISLTTVILIIMSELINGAIKCHKLPNSSPPYNVGRWIDSMVDFMGKPIFNQLMELKGYDIE